MSYGGDGVRVKGVLVLDGGAYKSTEIKSSAHNHI